MSKKLVFIAGGVVLLLALAGGGTFAFLTMSAKPADKSAVAKPVAPKPIFFAALNDLVVSIPENAGDPPTSYAQLAIQFSTFDANAVTSFTALEPIIKSQIINVMLNQTGKSLTDPAARATLLKNCLDISNAALDKDANYTPPDPFTAAYITNLVVQN
jgi:flagellar basal body-associated protein FliL